MLLPSLTPTLEKVDDFHDVQGNTLVLFRKLGSELISLQF